MVLPVFSKLSIRQMRNDAYWTMPRTRRITGKQGHSCTGQWHLSFAHWCNNNSQYFSNFLSLFRCSWAVPLGGSGRKTWPGQLGDAEKDRRFPPSPTPHTHTSSSLTCLSPCGCSVLSLQQEELGPLTVILGVFVEGDCVSEILPCTYGWPFRSWALSRISFSCVRIWNQEDKTQCNLSLSPCKACCPVPQKEVILTTTDKSALSRPTVFSDISDTFRLSRWSVGWGTCCQAWQWELDPQELWYERTDSSKLS